MMLTVDDLYGVEDASDDDDDDHHHHHDDDAHYDDDSANKTSSFWNDHDAFSHAGCAKILFRYSGVLIFYSHHGHFYHGRETIVNHIVASVIASQQHKDPWPSYHLLWGTSQKVSLSCSVHVTFLDDDILGTWPHGRGLLSNLSLVLMMGLFLGCPKSVVGPLGLPWSRKTKKRNKTNSKSIQDYF